jgi:hypothetical protein
MDGIEQLAIVRLLEEYDCPISTFHGLCVTPGNWNLSDVFFIGLCCIDVLVCINMFAVINRRVMKNFLHRTNDKIQTFAVKYI